VLARLSGDRWSIGAISAGDAKTLSTPPNALGGGHWLADLIKDAPGTGRPDVVHTTSTLGSLSVAVPQNGGFAAIRCPARPGRTSCYQSILHVPDTSLSLTPTRTVNVQRGASFTVSAEFTLLSPRTVTDVRLAPQAPSGWTVTGTPVIAREPRAKREAHRNGDGQSR
jgi:hypothetical protein